MQQGLRQNAETLYLILAACFVAALITCNLIANKFVSVDLGFLGFQNPFIISAGVLPYPITFIITDVLSEFYGRRRTNRVVLVGFVASLFVLFILFLGSRFDSILDSPINNAEYNKMFQNSWRVIGASMTAYLVAQLADVRLFHFWKNLTKGKHLWLRNNGSTIVSQLVDTVLVVSVLFIGQLSVAQMGGYIRDGWTFKLMVALVDTPIIYLVAWAMRRYFKLLPGEELQASSGIQGSDS